MSVRLGVTPSSGNDPEILLLKRGRIVPAEKALMERDDVYGQEWRVTIDNAAVELHTTPSSCLQGLISQTRMALGQANRRLRGKLSRMATFAPSALINLDDLYEYRSLRDFGCSPSYTFDNESLVISSPRLGASETEIRSAGYHVHLGDNLGARSLTPLKQTDFQIRLVKMCNLFAGIPGVLMEKDYTDEVIARRETVGYGRAGEFRAQRYGFEYRTLGPWPLTHSGWLYWAHSAVRDAYFATTLNLDAKILSYFDLGVISRTINTNDVKEAFTIWNRLDQILKEFDDETFKNNGLGHVIFNPKYRKAFTGIISLGGLSFVGGHFSLRSWGSVGGFSVLARRVANILSLGEDTIYENESS